MKQSIDDRRSYEKITAVFRRQRAGVTVADVVAKTALPLETVRALAPQAADEYSARLEVTESGEILYSFPRGFTSKYRGAVPTLRRLFAALGRGVRAAAVGLFKAWIMLMLVGYFVLFMLLALAVFCASLASSRNSNSSRNDSGFGAFAGSLLNMIFRIWFWSSVFDSLDGRRYERSAARRERPKGKPLYKAIFSFVFGDGDPNADITTRENQALIAYIQANAGVISLPEFMMFTGAKADEADGRICGFCAQFGGLPEATEDGTVVYRFDDLLRRADRRERALALSAPLRRLRRFSSNETKANVSFALINAVNLLFGGYFFYNALSTGEIIARAAGNSLRLLSATGEAASYFYAVTYHLLSGFVANPLPVITVGLGAAPLAFSALFWLIPALRALGLKSANEEIKRGNLRKSGYSVIWSHPHGVTPAMIKDIAPECRPANMKSAGEQVIKDMGVYSPPEVSLNEAGQSVYTFTALDEEKRALQKYRRTIDPAASSLGQVVFDSE